MSVGYRLKDGEVLKVYQLGRLFSVSNRNWLASDGKTTRRCFNGVGIRETMLASKNSKIHTAREAKMSKSRLFSLFVIVALIAVAVLLVHGGITTSEVAANQNAVLDLDQHERHPGFINSSAIDSLKAAALAEQARLEFRRGEWNAGSASTAAAVAEQARLEYRRGEWNVGRSTPATEFDVEQARIGWRAGK
jgi:hypothetical protein